MKKSERKEATEKKEPHLQYLSMEECEMIHGGESPLFWVGYILGSLVRGLTGSGQGSGPAVYSVAIN